MSMDQVLAAAGPASIVRKGLDEIEFWHYGGDKGSNGSLCLVFEQGHVESMWVDFKAGPVAAPARKFILSLLGDAGTEGLDPILAMRKYEAFVDYVDRLGVPYWKDIRQPGIGPQLKQVYLPESQVLAEFSSRYLTTIYVKSKPRSPIFGRLLHSRT